MLKKIFKNVFWSVFIVMFLAAAGGIGGLAYVFYQVRYGDYTQLKKTTILAMFQEETSLFYNDDKTRIGSIFESRHRRYVPIDEIPAHMINAVVAVEDKNFYRHVGIDPLAIASALFEGATKRGNFRRGASTLTQQTVKNIINDWEPSFSRKFREMIRALQLERIYDKRQILEFYLNQFHVVGNGNGVDIASRYYFDKDVKDLDLVEAAFIAGSVKAPGKYNPFIKFSKEEKEQAKVHANDRKNYVLLQMFEQTWITQDEYKTAVATKVPFKKGEFRTAEVSLVDLIQGQLEKKEILEALGIKSPDELSIAGLKVFTTIDMDFQRAAQLAMRRNLSRLESILGGFAPEAAENYRKLRDLKVDEFVYGKVTEITSTSPKTASLKVSFGVPHGVVPNESLVRYAKILNLVDGRGHEYYLQQLLSKIKVGDTLYLEVMSHDHETNEAVLELHKRPTISGGLIALDKGEVRAIISGFDTLGYNRAVTAKRQAGSVFKAPVYFAALQLGWSILDRLDNIRQVFPYQGRFYFPRPDHRSPYESVSLLWSGVMSENLASVSLAAHLLDKVNFDQFKQLLKTMGLSPNPDEVPRDYHYRVAKETGVQLDNDGVEEFQLTNAVNDLAPDLVFGGDDSVLKKLKLMWWGQGYVDELRRILLSSGEDNNLKEKAIRKELVMNNYLRVRALNSQLVTDIRVLQSRMEKSTLEQLFQDPVARLILNRFRVLSDTPLPKIAYYYKLTEEERVPQSAHLPLLDMSGRPLMPSDLESLIKSAGIEDMSLGLGSISESIWIDGFVQRKTINQITHQIAKHMDDIKRMEDDPYRLFSYFQHHDFRIGLGLKYLVKLAQASGVQNRLEAVLSYPLGTNDVTTSEVAKIYQTFMAGKTYKFYEEGASNQISFIRRIEDRFGNVLYEANPKEEQLVAPHIAQQVREILRRVVTHGTGRRARGELYVSLPDNSPEAKGAMRQVRVPSFGKTGTTNDFTTAYFAGFMPYPTEKGKPLNPENSYTVATYVGYDMNKIMRKGMQRIYGGVGALPIWTDFLKEVISIKKYADYIDPNIKIEWPLMNEARTVPYLVELPRGLILSSGGGETENFRTTNISKNGEEYVNDYELRDTPNSTVLNLSPDPSHRLFSPFQLGTKVKE